MAGMRFLCTRRPHSMATTSAGQQRQQQQQQERRQTNDQASRATADLANGLRAEATAGEHVVDAAQLLEREREKEKRDRAKGREKYGCNL